MIFVGPFSLQSTRRMYCCFLFIVPQCYIASLVSEPGNISTNHDQPQFKIQKSKSSATTDMISGAVARACAQLAVFPFDCIKTRQQARGGAGTCYSFPLFWNRLGEYRCILLIAVSSVFDPTDSLQMSCRKPQHPCSEELFRLRLSVFQQERFNSQFFLGCGDGLNEHSNPRLLVARQAKKSSKLHHI